MKKKKKILLVNRALTNVDILRYIKNCKILHFRSVFMRDKLPRKIYKNDEKGIINLDNSCGPGTHWVAYKKHGNQIIYFDSYGNLPPPLEVRKYFKSNGQVQIYYNYNKYQTLKKRTYNCGQLCIEFLLNK